MSLDPQRVQSLFLAVVEAGTPSARAVLLEQQCGPDAELRRRLEALLRAHDESRSFLDAPTPDSPATVDDPIRERSGTIIGPYKLMEQIGEGGMGLVFVAEQQEPVRRKVALKVIKPGMDTRQVVARFEAERQALALMDHPNIAKVLDGGQTSSGRPYFVMELVKGKPITEYCDQNQVPIRQRLELFVDVCQAVQHAHQKGIIHRDLKPSNVLVVSHDGAPVVKVIDFGVAKAIGQRLTDKTIYTQFSQMVGTPLYMSPEQAGESGLDIDTRSDIYSLGVLLYELLTGTTPFDKERLGAAGYDEMRRIIREEEPPKPSTRISTLGQAATTVSTNRRSDAKQLSWLFRGELDWIVMKALEKDRNRRYETANAFAADVQCYLHDEPVLACPPSVGYRLRKFVRRNKVPVLAVSLVLLALVAGIVGTTIGLFQAKQAQRREGQRADGERQAKQEAEAKQAETQAVLDFVENKIFAAARPEGQRGGMGRDVTLHKAIAAALPFVETSFKEQPLIEARLRMTIGTSFWCMSESKKAAEQYQAARTIFTKERGPDHPDTLKSMYGLALSYYDLGRPAEAVKPQEETLALRKAKLGPDHPETLKSMNNLARGYLQLGQYDAALKLFEETLALRKAKLGLDHPETLMSMNNLAACYETFGRYKDSLRLNEQALALRKVTLGPHHPDTLLSMSSLASLFDSMGRHADALKLREETLALCKAELGPEHARTIGSMNDLAESFAALGRHAEALKLREETLALRKAKLGLDHPETLKTMNNLASSYNVLGRHGDALKLYEETLTRAKAKLGPDHVEALRSMHGMAKSLIDLHRGAEAVPIIDECLRLAAGKAVHRGGIDAVFFLRLQHFQNTKNVAGCRATAGMYEQRHRTDGAGLYNAACMRAVTAAVLRATDKSAAAEKEANAEADRAMAWLKQSVAAGYSNVKHLKRDTDLDCLRDRDDFKRLMSELEAKNVKGVKK